VELSRTKGLPIAEDRASPVYLKILIN